MGKKEKKKKTVTRQQVIINHTPRVILEMVQLCVT